MEEIINNYSFQINSSYENFNLISKNKLIADNTLQKKMKDYLLNQINILPKNNFIENKLSRFKSLENKKGNNYYYKKEFIELNQNQNTTVSKNIRKSNFFINDNSISQKIIDNCISEKSIANQNHKAKNKNRLSLPQINIETDKKKSLSQKDLVEENINTEKDINNDNKSLIDFQNKREVMANPIPIITSPKLRKKKGSILDKINFNIQKRNQNLNNPDIFYSNYFNSIIRGELNQKQNNKKNIVADSLPNNDKLKSTKEKSINKNP